MAMAAVSRMAAAPAVSSSGNGVTNTANPVARSVTLPVTGGTFQLKLGLDGARDAALLLNGWSLEACGETLLTAPTARIASNSGKSDFADWADVLVDGHGFDPAFTNSLAVMDRLSGKDWEYVVVDATPAYGKRLTRFRRHLLFVQTNLFVIYDDLAAPAPALFEYRLRSPSELSLEDRSGDLRLELPKAGLTAHWLSPANRSFDQWRADGAAPGAAVDILSGRTLHTTATNRLLELRALTAIVTHCAGQKKGTGFKLLESETAIGARIHRDGLPTLVAFRTVDTGEPNLTGLKFAAPVAVDVFRPKPRRQ